MKTSWSAINAFTTDSKRIIQKTVEASGSLIDNKISDKNTKISGISLQKSSSTVTNEIENNGLDSEITKYMYVCTYIYIYIYVYI